METVPISCAVKILQSGMRHGDVIALIVDIFDRFPIDRACCGVKARGRNKLICAIGGQFVIEGSKCLGNGALRS